MAENYISYSINYKKCFLLFFTLFFSCFWVLKAPLLGFCQDFFLLNAANIKYQPGTITMELFFSTSRNREIEKMLKNSISMNIRCDVLLEKKRSFLPNKNIYTLKEEWQLRYEPLTQEFVLYPVGQAPIRKNDLNELLKVFFENFTLTLNPISELEKNDKYALNLTLTMSHGDIPPWLENTLFFWKWDVLSNTYTFELVP